MYTMPSAQSKHAAHADVPYALTMLQRRRPDLFDDKLSIKDVGTLSEDDRVFVMWCVAACMHG